MLKTDFPASMPDRIERMIGHRRLKHGYAAIRNKSYNPVDSWSAQARGPFIGGVMVSATKGLNGLL
jgi:hypothetical protein